MSYFSKYLDSLLYRPKSKEIWLKAAEHITETSYASIVDPIQEV